VFGAAVFRSTPVTPGAILGGKYRLLSLLGRGGMGSVWRAERMGWQSLVAIKLINSSLADDSQALDRFRREARSTANLRSLHVVQILDDGVDEASGAPFIVMELLEGETLAERLARVGRLGPADTARIVRQIARALGRAHDAGMIHRDLKPDNIFLVQNDDEEVAKVLDFGIAKWTATSHKLDHPTLTGHVLGTLSYMSPEQIKGNMDHRADLWSLAVIACECLTGVRPFRADNFVSLALVICSGEAPLPSSLGPATPAFDRWFARALAADLGKRFSSARNMADELSNACGLARPYSLPAPVSRSLHATSDPTEAELVLELKRRLVRSPSLQPVETGSVVPTYQTPRSSAAPARPHWGSLVAGLAFAAVCVLALGVWRTELVGDWGWLSSVLPPQPLESPSAAPPPRAAARLSSAMLLPAPEAQSAPEPRVPDALGDAGAEPAEPANLPRNASRLRASSRSGRSLRTR
jgi:serine/threonine protein kinase